MSAADTVSLFQSAYQPQTGVPTPGTQVVGNAYYNNYMQMHHVHPAHNHFFPTTSPNSTSTTTNIPSNTNLSSTATPKFELGASPWPTFPYHQSPFAPNINMPHQAHHYASHLENRDIKPNTTNMANTPTTTVCSPSSSCGSSNATNHNNSTLANVFGVGLPPNYGWMNYNTDIRVRTREKYRMVYSDQQRLELEKEFITNQYINTARKTQLSSDLGLTERQVKIWFQNRRAKNRKVGKKSGVEGSNISLSDDEMCSPRTTLDRTPPTGLNSQPIVNSQPNSHPNSQPNSQPLMATAMHPHHPSSHPANIPTAYMNFAPANPYALFGKPDFGHYYDNGLKFQARQ